MVFTVRKQREVSASLLSPFYLAQYAGWWEVLLTLRMGLLTLINQSRNSLIGMPRDLSPG